MAQDATKRRKGKLDRVSIAEEAHRAVPGISVWIPLQTVSEANMRENYWARHGRKKKQQAKVFQYLLPVRYMIRSRAPLTPIVVKLTRFGKKKLDPDNYVGSWKHVQDEVARFLGVDDGDESKVRWVYADQVLADGYAIRIHFAPAGDERESDPAA